MIGAVITSLVLAVSTGPALPTPPHGLHDVVPTSGQSGLIGTFNPRADIADGLVTQLPDLPDLYCYAALPFGYFKDSGHVVQL